MWPGQVNHQVLTTATKRILSQGCCAGLKGNKRHQCQQTILMYSLVIWVTCETWVTPMYIWLYGLQLAFGAIKHKPVGDNGDSSLAKAGWQKFWDKNWYEIFKNMYSQGLSSSNPLDSSFQAMLQCSASSRGTGFLPCCWRSVTRSVTWPHYDVSTTNTTGTGFSWTP